MNVDVVLQALVVAGATALATGFVNGKIIESKLKDLTHRIDRIEKYLNGLLTGLKTK